MWCYERERVTCRACKRVQRGVVVVVVPHTRMMDEHAWTVPSGSDRSC